MSIVATAPRMVTKSDLSFVFMDESGNKDSDRFFVCGFLQIEDNIEFSRRLQRVVSQIKNLSIRNRQSRVERLFEEKNLEELKNLAKTYNSFELKHYHISNENQALYSDLLKVLWNKTAFRFTAIVFDKKDEKYIKDENEHKALYLKALKLYTSNCAQDIKYVYVPDNFDINFNWSVTSGNLPVAILPLDSIASLQVQVADILTGLIAQALRIARKEDFPRKDAVCLPVLNTLEELLGKKIVGNLTVTAPNYFSVWVVQFRQ